jgi:hypothetical protein
VRYGRVSFGDAKVVLMTTPNDGRHFSGKKKRNGPAKRKRTPRSERTGKHVNKYKRGA